MSKSLKSYLGAFALLPAVATMPFAQAVEIKGPSSSQTPYIVALEPKVSLTSILTVGDAVGTKPDGSPYRMVGIPDGLGAFDNGDGTFTVLMNHELGATSGVVRAHGAVGSFISRLTIRKDNLQVVRAEDLIQNAATWNPATTSYNAPAKGVVFNRFCSADLPELSAFFAGGVGYNGRLFMNGEEAGAEGRAFAHATDGTSYELPRLGKFSWENSLAHPATGAKTLVIGTDDSGGGQIYAYIGDKTNAGSPVDRAGLTNGALYGIKVSGFPVESRESNPPIGARFELAPFGNVENATGAQLETASVAAGVTSFLRPEDGAWDPKNPRDFYFVTTDRFSALKEGTGIQDGRSRLWRLRFDDVNDPTRGGTIEALLIGSEPQQMMDNMAIDSNGQILLQEDPGGQNYIAKIRLYDIASNTMRAVAQHDPNRFVVGTPGFLTFDEESSGIIDMSEILGRGTYLLDVQAHYATDSETVQGGQLLMMSLTPPSQAPIAVDDTASAANGLPTEIDVLANDSDIDGDRLTVSAVSSGLRGTTQINAAGKVVYTPESGFVGTDAFSYTVSDGRGGLAVGRVIVQVTDTVAPVVTITTPRQDALQRDLKLVTGTVDDPTATVEVEIYSTQKYFDGREFTATRTRIRTIRDGNKWIVPAELLPTPTTSIDGVYVITAFATDRSGNAKVAQVKLRVDGNAPTAFIGVPRDKSVVTSLPLIAGRAIDGPGGSGVARVALTLRRANDGLYWNGQAYVATPVALEARIDGFNFSIRENLPAGENLTNGTYRFTLYAFDRAGNRSVVQSAIQIVSAAPAG